jgi:hypothetical protein
MLTLRVVRSAVVPSGMAWRASRRTKLVVGAVAVTGAAAAATVAMRPDASRFANWHAVRRPELLSLRRRRCRIAGGGCGY